MGTDRRCRYDEAILLEAARLHDAGLGRWAIGARLGVPHETVRKWLDKYRSVDGEHIADKTVLKMMRETGLRCGIRRETDYHRYNSYRGVVGETFENVLGRDFAADGPWQKMGTDIMEFKLSFGKAYLALLASIHSSPFSPTYFRQSRQRGYAAFGV